MAPHHSDPQAPGKTGPDRRAGVLTDWRDDRGFGWITPVGGGARVFAHVSEFPRGPRPAAGLDVTYVVVRDERNRTRATQVRCTTRAGVRTTGRGTAPALVVAALFGVALAGLRVRSDLPLTVLVVYGLASVLTFVMYGADKAAARGGDWRTPESTLHMLALVGGWPGALVARPYFRHKTTKQPFRTIFWGTVVVNCVALAWVAFSAPLPLP